MNGSDPIVFLIADSQTDSLADMRNQMAMEAPGCRVICADAGKSALELAKGTPPQAVLADMRLKDMSGLKLLLKVKALHSDTITMMMSDCGSHEARTMCLDAGVDFFFEKPIDLKKLMGMLGTEESDVESVFRGTLDNLNVPDVLQLIICRPSPMLMRIDSPHGEGAIEIENGNVIHARANGCVGEAAFYELVTWESGHFEVVDVVCAEERTIALPLPMLLMNAANQETGNAALQDASESIQDHYQTFFPEEATAPDMSHVWAPMAEYARPQVQRSRRLPTQRTENGPSKLNRLKAFHYQADESVNLRLRPMEKSESRFSADSPRAPGSALPARRPGRARSRRSLVPATRRIALASLAAVAVLFAGVRYSGFMGGQYGRSMGPLLNNLFGEFIPVEAETSTAALAPSNQYSIEGVRVGNPAVDARSSAPPSTPAPAKAPTPQVRTRPLEIGLTQSEVLTASANSIGVSPAVAKALKVHDNPWVEVRGANGKKIGAFAVELTEATTPVLLTKSLYYSLAEEGTQLTHVTLQPVTWIRQASTDSLVFGRSRSLSGQMCEYWYSVGLSLKAMRIAGLTPGAYATVRGPTGDQSVRVQLVDRGQSGEIWLSQPVQESIGAVDGKDLEVKLFPKT